MRHTLLLLLILVLTACADGSYTGTLIFEGVHDYDAATQLPGDVLLRAGDVTFARGAQVDGSIVVVGGELRFDGRAGGDLIVLDGRVTLGPGAAIGGDVRSGGAGSVVGVDSAEIGGDTITSLTLPEPDSPRTRLDDLVRWLVSALLLAAVAAALARGRPRTLNTIAHAATVHWPPALAIGVLALLVLPILLVLMAFTIVLLPLVALLVALLGVMVALGLIALGEWTGRRVWQWRCWPPAPVRATFAATLALLLLFAVPWVGGALALVSALVSFGAVWLTRFGTRPFTPSLAAASNDPDAYARPRHGDDQ